MAARHPHQIPSLLFSAANGEILDYAGLQMAGAAGGHFFALKPEDLIELPPGSELFRLPARLPVGIDPANGEPMLLDEDPFHPGAAIQAVAAFMAPAHTAIYSASYVKQGDQAPVLPLFAYTAVGWAEGRFWVSGFRSDPDRRQDADQFDQARIQRATQAKLLHLRHNRLAQHLGKCCLSYGCPAARNYFLGRWEAPLPTSPSCNAACAGCISLQPSGCCPSTQDRIRFVPHAEEIAEIAVPHLKKAQRAIVSFGQGCEGEPLLQAELIEQAIVRIRSQTSRGVINLNTNGSLPHAVERLARAGLNSIRLSLNSAQTIHHQRYYQPRGFSFADVCASITAMKKSGGHVSLNYFILPGCTDAPEEEAAFSQLIDQYRPDLIQLRNLNMDPQYYQQVIDYPTKTKPIGMRRWMKRMKTRFPWLRFGYYNPYFTHPNETLR